MTDRYRRWVDGLPQRGLPEAASDAGIGSENVVFAAMRKRFSYGGPQAYAYLLFILIYFPCVGALSAITRELGKGFAALNVTYLTVLGWIVATLFFQIAVARELVWIAVAVGLLGLIYGVFRIVGWKAGISSTGESE